MPIPLLHQQANDKHFLSCIKMKMECYMWKDNQNIYNMSSGRSIKPATMKGFVELCGITTKGFAKIFIDLPDVVEIGGFPVMGEFNKDVVLDWIEEQK